MYDDGDGKCKAANLDKAMKFNKEGRRDAFINEEYRENYVIRVLFAQL